MIETIAKLKHITDHSLTKKIFSDAMSLQQDLYDPSQAFELESKSKREFTELEYYSTRCGFTLSHLLGLLDQITKIPSYMLKYRSNDITRKYAVTRIDDVTYHYENFIIKYKSIEDRILLFCTAIYHLGINSSDVNYKLVIDNSHITSKDNITKHIKELHKQVDVYGSQRNKIIHQHSIANADLRKIEGMLILSRSDDELKQFAKSRYRILINDFVTNAVPEIEKYLLRLFEIIIAIFNCCQIEYDRKFKSLSDRKNRPTRGST